MKDIIPEEFKIEYTFFIGGVNSLKFNNKLIFIHENRNDPIKKITLEIEALEDDWIDFWNKMDEIRVWNWKKSYGFETEEEVLKKDDGSVFINADGDIWNILITKVDKKIESKGWADGPRKIDAFFDALYNLIKVDIRNPNLLSKTKSLYG